MSDSGSDADDVPPVDPHVREGLTRIREMFLGELAVASALASRSAQDGVDRLGRACIGLCINSLGDLLTGLRAVDIARLNRLESRVSTLDERLTKIEASLKRRRE